MILDKFYFELLERGSGSMNLNNQSLCMSPHPTDATGSGITFCDKLSFIYLNE